MNEPNTWTRQSRPSDERNRLMTMKEEDDRLTAFKKAQTRLHCFTIRCQEAKKRGWPAPESA